MPLQVITTEIMLDKLIIKVHHQLFVCIGLFRSHTITFWYIVPGCTADSFQWRPVLCIWGCHLPNNALLQSRYRGRERKLLACHFHLVEEQLYISRCLKSSRVVQATRQRQCCEDEPEELLTIWSSTHQGRNPPSRVERKRNKPMYTQSCEIPTKEQHC